MDSRDIYVKMTVVCRQIYKVEENTNGWKDSKETELVAGTDVLGGH
jgi:hypothetical protein